MFFFTLFLFSSSLCGCVPLDLEGADKSAFNFTEKTLGSVKVTEYSPKEGNVLNDEHVGGGPTGEDITKVTSGSRPVWESNGPTCQLATSYNVNSVIKFIKLNLYTPGQDKASVHYELENDVYLPIPLADFETKLAIASGFANLPSATLDISKPVPELRGRSNTQDWDENVKLLQSVADGVVLTEFQPKDGVRLAKVVDGENVLFKSDLYGCSFLSISSFNGEKKLAQFYIPTTSEGRPPETDFLHLERVNGAWKKLETAEYHRRYKELKGTLSTSGSFELDLEKPDSSLVHVNAVKEGDLDVNLHFPLPDRLINKVRHGNTLLWEGKEGEKCLAALLSVGGPNKAVVLSYKDSSGKDQMLFFSEKNGKFESCEEKELAFLKGLLEN